jgi:hypothetical protein
MALNSVVESSMDNSASCTRNAMPEWIFRTPAGLKRPFNRVRFVAQFRALLCTDPPEPAPATPLMRKPPRAFSFPAPGRPHNSGLNCPPEGLQLERIASYHEGVTAEKQLHALRNMECAEIQGPIFSPLADGSEIAQRFL